MKGFSFVVRLPSCNSDDTFCVSCTVSLLVCWCTRSYIFHDIHDLDHATVSSYADQLTRYHDCLPRAGSRLAIRCGPHPSPFQCLVDTYLCNLLAPVLVNHVITHTYKLAMSYKISGSRLQEETAFAKRYLDQISEHAVNYADDFVTPPEKRPRRMPVLAVSKE